MFEIVALVLLSKQPLMPVAEGVASYYTVASSSDLTASGEAFRDDQYTCAMLEGEFGTYYLVVAENGNSVVVRLNDRGPYVDERIIDLSKAAIRRLHPTSGLVRVKIYPLGKIDPVQQAALNRRL
jgi:rare lipoprotein A